MNNLTDWRSYALEASAELNRRALQQIKDIISNPALTVGMKLFTIEQILTVAGYPMSTQEQADNDDE